MTTWNHRVTRDKHGLGIREVYYDRKGRIEMWTEDTVGPFGDTLEELARDLGLITAALGKPVVDVTGDKPIEES